MYSGLGYEVGDSALNRIEGSVHPKPLSAGVHFAQHNGKLTAWCGSLPPDLLDYAERHTFPFNNERCRTLSAGDGKTSLFGRKKQQIQHPESARKHPLSIPITSSGLAWAARSVGLVRDDRIPDPASPCPGLAIQDAGDERVVTTRGVAIHVVGVTKQIVDDRLKATS